MLKERYGVDSELKHGPSGSFEVSVDGHSVVKKVSVAFPTEEQILEEVGKALGP